MKASWSGYVKIGELTVPMRLYSAVKTTAPQFVQLHAIDNSPVTRVTKCKQDGKELSPDDIVKAVEREGQYITLPDNELRTSGADDKTIIVRQFSDPATIDPIYYEKPYYMVPGKGGEVMYTLLRQAFVRTGKVAVTTFMLQNKEHIGIVTVSDGILMLQQLRFADELVPRSDIKTPALPQPAPDQVEIAVKLMERYSTPFYIEDYRNEQRDMLHEMIDRKAKGLPIKRQARVAPHTTPKEELVPKLQALLSQRSDQLSQTPGLK